MINQHKEKIMKKDYSLMRPFDQKAAKEGDSICWNSSDEKLTGRYLAGPDKSGDVAFEDVDGDLYVSRVSEFRMTPLCWVEGKPVYKGAVLYAYGDRVTANGTRSFKNLNDEYLPVGEFGENVNVGSLTWNPPMVKREGWLNVYGFGKAAVLYETKSEADKGATTPFGKIAASRLDCVRIEWEESAV